MAYATDRIQAVHALRAAGLSQSAAAAAAGVSRRTVQRFEASARSRGRPSPVPDLDPPYGGKPTRCTVCGATVVPPCRACSLRSMPPAGQPNAAGQPALGLDLRPRHHARYLDVARTAAIDAVMAEHGACPEGWLLDDGLPEPSDEVLEDLARRRAGP